MWPDNFLKTFFFAYNGRFRFDDFIGKNNCKISLNIYDATMKNGIVISNTYALQIFDDVSIFFTNS